MLLLCVSIFLFWNSRSVQPRAPPGKLWKSRPTRRGQASWLRSICKLRIWISEAVFVYMCVCVYEHVCVCMCVCVCVCECVCVCVCLCVCVCVCVYVYIYIYIHINILPGTAGKKRTRFPLVEAPVWPAPIV